MASTTDEVSFAALLSKLTLEEKISLLSGNSFNTTPGIPRVDIPQIKVADSINGIRPSALDGEMTTASFPSTTCLGSTWDAELLGRMGEQLAHQARLKSAQVVLGPTINIHRDPRAGRNFECFSEDPLLSGQLGGAIVNGIQKHGVGACPKHFVCNDSETMRHHYNVKESPHGRTIREIYLAAWQHLLRVSDPVALMAAYNKVDGSYCSENETLMTEILRKTFGYQGVLMSDWFGTRSTAASVKAGLDLEMPFPIFRGTKLVKEVELGTVTEAEIDQRALKMLQLRDRTKTCHSDAEEKSEISEETNKVARELVAGGLVLLKNENNTLPLNTSQPIKVAVIGEFAVEPIVTGGGSASCKPQYKLKPLELLQQAFSEHGGSVQYSPGVRTRRIIPVAPTEQLTAADGRNGVDVSYFNDSNPSQPILTEHQPSPHVFMLGQFKPGLDVPGSRLELTTTLTPSTSGTHTLAVRCTGAFTLTVDGTPVLSRPTQAAITTEQFLFHHALLETRTTLPMAAHQPHALHLVMHSRTELTRGEPTPYAATLAFEEEYSEAGAIADAAALAQQSDVSVVFCGRSDQDESEGFDLEGMELPASQVRMVQAVAAAAAAAGKRTVLVLQGGNPIDVSAFVDGVQAVVLAHFLGQEGLRAVVDVLCGRVNPSGRLATTWWKTLEEAPSFGHFPAVEGEGGVPEIGYVEGVGMGYRCEGVAGRARWPFGFGLSYTEFSYDGLQVTVDGESVRSTVGVTNIGRMEGKEVVQLYVRGSKSAAVWRPERELKVFTKISLQPGERKVVELDAHLKIAGSYWDERGHTWRLEEGKYEVEVGDLLGEFTVTKTVEWNHL